jgi:predicted secreted Zn-dependent protease
MKRALASGLLLLLGLHLAQGPAAAASLSRRYVHYTLVSPTLSRLQQELSRQGPTVDSTGERHPGATRIEIQLKVDYELHGGYCRVARADATVNARITLPRWKPPRQPPRNERIVWETLIADIRRHEDRHVGIAMNHARELEQAVASLDRERDCRRLEQRVDRLTARILDRHSKAQERFDRIESTNFEDRLGRLLDYRLQRTEKRQGPGRFSSP